MAIDYLVLGTEITTDPNGFGYKAFVDQGADDAVAKILNTSNAGITTDIGVLPSYKIFEAIVVDDYLALSDVFRQYVDTLLSMGLVDTAGTNTRFTFNKIFGGTQTETNFLEMVTRNGSRAEELFGVGVVIGHVDVAKALGRAK